MQELNQLEKQLEQRSVKELEEIVDTFLDSVAKIKSKTEKPSVYKRELFALKTFCCITR